MKLFKRNQLNQTKSSKDKPPAKVTKKAKVLTPIELTVNFLKEIPPDQLLELLTPHLTMQIVDRSFALKERRKAVEERLQELNARREDAQKLNLEEQH